MSDLAPQQGRPVTARRLPGLAALGASLLLATAASGWAQQPTPTIDAPVTDLAGVLSSRDVTEIGMRLRAHQAATGVQAAVLIVDTTDGEPIESYAVRVATAWEGGSRETDRGLLFVLAISDRRMRLEVGYGLEDRIPDSVSAALLRRAVPYLRRGDHAGAVEIVMDGVIGRTGDAREAAPAEQADEPAAEDGLHRFVVYFLVILLCSIVAAIYRKQYDRRVTECIAELLPPPTSPAFAGAFALALSGTLPGLLGYGWFHYAAGVVGLMAGWRFAWRDLFTTVHYGLMMMFFRAFAVVMGRLVLGPLGVSAGWVVQMLMTLMYSTGETRSVFSGLSVDTMGSTSSFARTARSWASSSSSESSSQTEPSDPFGPKSFFDFGPSHNTSSSSSLFSSSSSSSSSSWFASSSSSSSFGSSSSSFGSSSSGSSSSGGYKGDGGGFGGGGASSSW